jgi:hypothetical protein
VGLPKPAKPFMADPISQEIQEEPVYTLVSLVKSGYNRPNIE